MKIEVLKSEKGAVLLIVVVLTLILTILGLSVLSVANSEIAAARKDVNKIKAFYVAEAGIQRLVANINCGVSGSIGETAFGGGSYSVDFNNIGIDPCAFATGTVRGETRRVQVTVSYLIPPYECGIYAGGLGGEKWTLMLTGTGNPISVSGGEYGGIR